ncbi:phage tail tape measure protein [Franconibacter pulveris 601]|uniref:phage tail tape measure protein n=1 Tax=Franconibacter pulveris TaxID=435910 RepID=UPI000465F3A8|nr:phage tail tape measure protein [Franconibacter pulveris]
MSDIATIALRVNTSELERGNKALDDFQQTAAGAANKADDLNSVFRAGADSQKKNSDSLKHQQQELQNLLNKISPVNKAMDELEKLQASLSGFRGKGLLGDDDYGHFNAVLETTRSKLFLVMEAETAEGQERLKLAQDTQRATAAQESFLKSITDQAATFRASKADLAEYRAAQMGIAEQAAPVIAQLREQERAVQQEAIQRQIAASQSRMLKQAIAELDAAQRAEAAELQRAQAIRESFTRTLQEQAEAIGKTRTELLELKAAELGVSAQAAPFIAKLREQESAWKSGEISAGQYQQAMRQLPGQITDVVTSLSAGMPVWMVAIQQGGQIKDSFGGVGNTLRALTSLINPVNVGLGLLAGTATLLAVAYFKGSAENEEFNKQLILTGNYAGQTAGQLSALAKSLSGNGVTQYASASVLAEVVGSGKFNADKLETVTRAAVAMQQATGQAVSETIANFKKLYDDPTKSSTELNSQMHYLTASQFEYISALERRGDKEAAGQAAADAYSRAEQQRSQQILSNLGLVERAANATRNAFKGMWDELLNIGRPQAPQDMLKQMESQLASLEKNLLPERQRMGYGYSYDTSSQDQEYDNRRKAQIAAIANLKAQISPLQQMVQQQQDYNAAQQTGVKINEDAIDAQQVINRYLDAGTTAAEKRRKAQDELNKAIADNAKAAKAGTATLWTPEDIAKARAGIEQLYKDPKTPRAKGVTVAAGDRAEDSAQAELLALQAQLKTLQDHRSVNDTISQQRKDLYSTESKFAVLEAAARTRQLSKQEQSLLASKEQVLQLARQKALIGDQITAQEQLNKRMDTAQKYVTQMAEKQAALETGSTMSDRLASRQTALSQLRSGWLNSGGSLEDAGYKQELQAANDYYAAEESLRNDWLNGVQKGWAEYLDSATNVYASMQNVAQSTLGGISDMLTNLVTTGKASFKSFAASMMKMIADVINRLLVAYAVQSALGWVTGSIGGGGGSTPSGAYTAATANVGFDGGGFTGDGGKYEPAGVVHRGEFVFTKEATSAIGVDNLYAMMRGAHGYASGGVVGRASMLGLSASAGASNNAPVINTTVNVDASGNASAQTSSSGDAMGRALATEVQNAATQVVQKHLKNGGLIYNFVKGR